MKQNTAEYTDSQLIAKTLENIENFSLIVEKYENQIRKYVMRLINLSKEDVEDIVQNIFIKTYCQVPNKL